MLSIWKLRSGVEEYYLSQVAQGLEDYYTGAGEAPGVWTGSGVAALGLTGDVTPEGLRAVLNGLDPATGLTPNGLAIVNRNTRRVPGFDLTFAVPKSVSVLYALGDPRIQGTVIDAAETALDHTLAWLEREACFVRRGTNNAANRDTLGHQWGTRRMATHGFLAARFRHRTSRAGDPHLHWHVLVANLAQGIDGRWTALDGTALYAAKRAAGVLFQAELRQQLSTRLGVSWGPLQEDSAEIAGIPQPILRLFSQRRTQIEEWLDANGRSGIEAAADAMLATRTAKQPTVNATALDTGWKDRAIAAGWGPDHLDHLLTHPRPAPSPVGERWLVVDPTVDGEPGRERVTDFDGWLAHLLEHRLTANDSTFTRFQLTQAIGGSLGPGAPIPTIEALVTRAMQHPDVIPTHDPTGGRATVTTGHGPVRDDRQQNWTSRYLLEVEHRYLTQLNPANRTVAAVPDGIVDQVLAERTLGTDQTAAVRTLTSGTAPVQVLVGKAGTGKTYTLGAIRDAHERAGWTVIGLAPSARAARELDTGAQIASTTIARHLMRGDTLDARTLVVVDEAGMTGTRDLAAIIDRARHAGAKVLLVGDHHQLPEISAGGAFRAAVEHPTVPTVELTVNRRQRHQWEIDALDHLRHGDPHHAWRLYHDHDRVVIDHDPARLYERVLTDWWQHVDDDSHTLIITGTRAEARALNRRARQLMHAAGRLTGPELDAGDRTFQTGDLVVLRHNDTHQTDPTGHAVAVDNGMTGTITAIAETGDITITLTGSSRLIVLDGTYTANGWLDHGYAITTHSAQGLTCDHALIVGPAGLTREATYVALSRARSTSRLYATVRQSDELTERHTSTRRRADAAMAPDVEETPESELIRRLNTSAAKHLASVHARRVAERAEMPRQTASGRPGITI